MESEAWRELLLPRDPLTHFRESFQTSNPLFLSLMPLTSGDGWMVFITSLLFAPPPLFTVPFFSAWKEAWCPLESHSQAKETLLSPGNQAFLTHSKKQTLDE